ncbi:MAG: flagellar protein FlgN [Bacteroidetes bacterium]|jgi:hypothetical protein|nr:flagellar protein FlgN [Bacteroidota bacterium]
MTDDDKKRLMEITAAEAVEFGKMAEVLGKKHDAISRLDTAAIQSMVSEELEVLNRVRVVEKERGWLLKQLGLNGKDLNDADLLEKKLGKADSHAYRRLHLDFQRAFSKVIQLNNISRVLLLHSLGFIRQNIRILTDDGRRKLVDKKA